jgi:hypothetical protein
MSAAMTDTLIEIPARRGKAAFAGRHLGVLSRRSERIHV